MNRMLRLTAALALGVLIGSAGVASAPLATPAVAAETPVQSVIRITNEHRAANGRRALAPQSSLNSMAQAWANRMSSLNRMEHSTNAWRTSKASPGYSLCCGENIAYGYTGAGAVVKGWMASAGHRANILDARYTHIGVGYAAKGNFWVQVFATYPTTSTSASITSSVPRLSGDSRVGKILSSSAGAWGPSGVKLSYQWYANGVAIPGARGARHLIIASQAGKRLTLVITGTYGGKSVARKSQPTPVIVR